MFEGVELFTLEGDYMRISYENIHQLTDIHVHDCLFSGYVYDYENRSVQFTCVDSYEKKAKTFCFQNVVLVQLQSCSFWHGGSNILWMNYDEEHPLLHQLECMQMEKQELFEGSFMDRGIRYLPIEFTINSGDVLVIISESVDYEEKPL